MRKILGWAGGICIALLLILHERLPEKVFFIPARDLVTSVWNAGWLPIVYFLDRHIDKIISWPVAFVVVGYVIVTNRVWSGFITSTASRIKNIDAFGLSLELTEQIRILKKESDDLFSILPVVREKIAQELRTQVEQMRLDPAFVDVVKGLSEQILKRQPTFDPSKCRATIHVESMLFSGELVQLLEYVSGDGTRYPGQTSGRNFSARRGIVGRVWRSGIPEISGVLPITNGKSAIQGNKIEHIAQIWGLYMDEAKHVLNYPSYIAIPLSYGSSQRCVFYMDSKIENAFPDQDVNDIKSVVCSLFENNRIASAISDIDRVVGIRGPRIEQLESVSG